MEKPPIIYLMGPTGSGKTELALALTQKFPTEIISVDSAMVYRGMNIGTAKPRIEILKNIPHHLIDICDPIEAYSAARFRKDALHLIQKIIDQKKIPLLVGGTMLYFHALQQGLAPMPGADQEIRASLLAEATLHGWFYLHQKLEQVDPQAAKRIHCNDTQRIQRALEVYMLTGKNISSWQQTESSNFNFKVISLAITPKDRAILHQRVEQRFILMLQNGFIKEVKQLFDREDLSIDLPALRSVGYRQVWQYLENKFTAEQMQAKAIAATRQLAKRQLTWLRGWPSLTWFDSQDPALLIKICSFLNKALTR